MLFWHWFVLAGVFFVFEIITFTTFFLFFGASAVAMALITLLFPEMTVTAQAIIASLLAVISMVCGYHFFKKRHIGAGDNPNDVNARMEKYIGRSATLSLDAKNGVSKIQMGDTQWRVLIDEGKAGDTVEITGFHSTSFTAKLKK